MGLLAERRAPMAAPLVRHDRLTMDFGPLRDDRGFLGLVLPWLALVALFAFAFHAEIAGLRMRDPDDYMRLLEVRAWLDGQSWWDVDNHRLGGAGGFSMHWSRLVDVPLAGLILLFDLFMTQVAAEKAAAALLPLLQLLGALALLRGTLRCLGFSGPSAYLGIAIVPLLPLATGVFAPLRIDHHGWQALCALAVTRLLVDRRRPVGKSALAGLVAALLVTISIEGLPLVAVSAAVLALWYLRDGTAARLAAFLGTLAAGSTALFVATRPFSHWSVAHADSVSWPHLAGFGAATAVAVLVAVRPRLRLPPARMVALGGITLAGIAVPLAALGFSAFAPFSALDPLLQTYWLDRINEVRPITRLNPDAMGMLLAMVILWGLAVLSKRSRMARDNPDGWFVVCLMSGAMVALSLVMFRVALVAQLLLVPLLALLLYDALRVASRFDAAPVRIFAIVLMLLALTPAGGGMLGNAAMLAQGRTLHTTADATARECDIAALSALPQGTVFATLDIAPEVLVRTPHRAVASGYHRNQGPMLQVVRGFTSPPAQARADVLASRADYLVLCPTAADTRNFAEAGPDSLAATLARGDAPRWLRPVEGIGGGARVYAVMR